MRKEVIGDCTLYCGDCREILSLLSADVIITDPPWGLGKLSGTISKERAKNAYSNYDDTLENLRESIIPACMKAIEKCGRGLVTPGQPNLFEWPAPRALGGFYQPAACGMSPWGFAGYNPVLFYGKDPRDGKGQSNIMTVLTDKPSCSEHPCSKPLRAVRWLVKKGSLDGETVLDIFCGSGTTLVACAQLGRKGIGIELDEGYFDIACRRVEAAYKQPDFFIEPPQKQKLEQDSLL